MKPIVNVLTMLLVLGSVGAENVKDSIKTLEHLLVNFNTSLSVSAFVCWEADDAVHLMRTLNARNFMVGGKRSFIFDNFPAHQHNNFVVLDLACENVEHLLDELDPIEFERRKMIVFDSVTEEKILEVFWNRTILPGSEIFYFDAEPDGVVVKQIYKTSAESSLIKEIFGKWFSSNDSFIDLREVKVTSQRRRNLMGTTLKASMVVTNNDTLNHLDDYHDKHIDTITKVNYQLTNRLIEALNATVRYSHVTSWGYKDNTTKQWSGMIGELVTKAADLGASPLFFTADRIDVIEYVACTSETRSKFVFRSPKLSYTENVFLLPFDGGVWGSLGAMIIIAAFVLYIASHAEWRSQIVTEPSDPTILRPSFYETFFVLFCAVCQQGSFALPITFGSRLVTLVSFLALMFMYASYSANIVALLQSPSSKIRTLDDLYNSRIKMGVDDTVFNHYYFSHAEERVRAKIYADKIKKKDGTENFYNLSDGVTLIREGLFAFHMEVGVGYKILLEMFQEDEKCGLQEIQYLQVIDPFYAIQKNSSYKEIFKVGLLRLHEFGLQERENARLYTKKPRCAGQGAKFISVGLFDVQPAFLIYLYGIGVAGLSYLIEKLHHRARGFNLNVLFSR